MNHMLPRAIAIVGPTASGKSALAICAADRFHGEIISCDSMQIYRGMDIGTAKVTAKEQQAVPHHLIDILPPDAPYSAADFGDDALTAVRDITARGKLPVFCGGTGLYLTAACTGRHDMLPPSTPETRAPLLTISQEEDGPQRLYEQLWHVDEEAARQIPPQNVRRVIRALEIYRTTGKTKTAWEQESRTLPKQLQILTFLLDFADREFLYRRIEKRIDIMMAQGLLEEVRHLWDAGYLRPDTTAGQAIGYKELLTHLQGECSLEDAVTALKTATRRYAKRQLTWFRALPDAIRITPDAPGGICRSAADMLAEMEPHIRTFMHP